MTASAHRFRNRSGYLPLLRDICLRTDREHLYKQVWSAPMPKIAKHYGVTELEIAKACRHLHIPTPPQGHWAQKDARLQPSTPSPLPPLSTLKQDHRTDSQS